MDNVLVLDANQRSALAIIRSLGHRELNLIAGDNVRGPLAAASKYCRHSVLYPDPAASPARFIDELIEIIRRYRIATVIPATDLTTMLLVRQPELACAIRLAAPNASSYEALTDKAHLISLATELGIPVPETRIATDLVDIRKAAAELGYPVVLKPSRSRYLKDGRVYSTSVEIALGPTQLAEKLDRLSWLSDIPCLVQQFVRGHGAGIFCLHAAFGPTAWFAHRRIREKPPSGGVSVLSESIHINAEMQSIAGKLLGKAAWTGVAMIEFRVSAQGVPYLMEVNGRFWGSLQLAIDCGIDFPWLLYQQISGLPTVPQSSYQLGRRLRWLWGDVDSLILQLRGSEFPLRSKMHIVRDFIWSFFDPACRQEIWRISDPRPALVETKRWMRNALRR